MGKKTKAIAAIDIGTTKISALAAEIDNDEVAVIGASSQPSYGVKKGIIINMDSTVDSIKNALEEVETMAGFDIQNALVTVSGNHIKGFSSNGVMPLSNREVKKNDITGSVEAAKAVVIPTEREVIQILPQEYIVDDHDGIRDPLGMSGVRLESRVYIVTGAIAVAQNIVRCLNRSGIKAQDMIIQQIASAASVLSEDEKELGCALVDIGGGTTDIAIFTRGAVRHCSVIPIGGNQITSDIAIGLRTPLSEAEEIKKDLGHARPQRLHNDGTIQVGTIGDRDIRTVSRSTLNQIIKARTEETLDLIKKELDASGLYDMLSAGIILTGGTAQMNGIVEAAENRLELPVRIGFPQIMGINDVRTPAYAACAGLVLFSANGSKKNIPAGKSRKPFWSVGDKMKQWFTEAF